MAFLCKIFLLKITQINLNKSIFFLFYIYIMINLQLKEKYLTLKQTFFSSCNMCKWIKFSSEFPAKKKLKLKIFLLFHKYYINLLIFINSKRYFFFAKYFTKIIKCVKNIHVRLSNFKCLMKCLFISGANLIDIFFYIIY